MSKLGNSFINHMMALEKEKKRSGWEKWKDRVILPKHGPAEYPNINQEDLDFYNAYHDEIEDDFKVYLKDQAVRDKKIHEEWLAEQAKREAEQKANAEKRKIYEEFKKKRDFIQKKAISKGFHAEVKLEKDLADAGENKAKQAAARADYDLAMEDIELKMSQELAKLTDDEEKALSGAGTKPRKSKGAKVDDVTPVKLDLPDELNPYLDNKRKQYALDFGTDVLVFPDAYNFQNYLRNSKINVIGTGIKSIKAENGGYINLQGGYKSIENADLNGKELTIGAQKAKIIVVNGINPDNINGFHKVKQTDKNHNNEAIFLSSSLTNISNIAPDSITTPLTQFKIPLNDDTKRNLNNEFDEIKTDPSAIPATIKRIPAKNIYTLYKPPKVQKPLVITPKTPLTPAQWKKIERISSDKKIPVSDKKKQIEEIMDIELKYSDPNELLKELKKYNVFIDDKVKDIAEVIAERTDIDYKQKIDDLISQADALQDVAQLNDYNGRANGLMKSYIANAGLDENDVVEEDFGHFDIPAEIVLDDDEQTALEEMAITGTNNLDDANKNLKP